MELELISAPTCPFVQRAVILLLEKKIEFKLTHIDLNHRPDWFLALSPTGKVPVLRVDGDTVLFESAVIAEFLDETTEPRLLPADPIERAKTRAWIAFASSLVSDVFDLMAAKDEEAFQEAENDLIEHLEQLEKNVEPSPYFNGPTLGLMDAAMAPVFMRLAWVTERRAIPRLAGLVRMQAWSKQLLATDSVKQSVRTDLSDLLTKAFLARGSMIAALQ